jgi:hypothetical protein
VTVYERHPAGLRGPCDCPETPFWGLTPPHFGQHTAALVASVPRLTAVIRCSCGQTWTTPERASCRPLALTQATRHALDHGHTITVEWTHTFNVHTRG